MILQPILSPSPVNGSWDHLFVTNPGPYIYPNGSALLIYKVGDQLEAIASHQHAHHHATHSSTHLY
jgi:hypothetical protein